MSPASVRVLATGDEVGHALAHDLEQAHAVSIAVAFAKPSALQAIDLRSWCRSERSLRLVVGTDFELTDLDILRDLGSRPNTQCRVMHRLTSAAPAVFHPKLYLLERQSSVVAYVGSSNLTLGGLRANVEANVRIEGTDASAPIVEARRAFESYFGHELATDLSPEFAARYDEREARAYAAGDVFFFHVTRRSEIAAMGMFTGDPYYDDSPRWRDMDERGAFPWRVRFVSLGELRSGLPTRTLLAASRPSAPKNWFHGFIQQSHSLEPADFGALRGAFEAALRTELPDVLRG